MVMRATENLIAARVFLIGVVLSLLVGFFGGIFGGSRFNSIILIILAGLGLIAGYFVAEKDVRTFLYAAVSVVVVSYVGVSGTLINSAVVGNNISQTVTSTLGALISLLVPATIVVALKSMFSISRS